MRSRLLVFLVAACGSSSSHPKDAASIDSPAIVDSGQHDAAPDAPSDIAVTLPGGANSLRWDAASSTLYFTNSNADTLMSWTQAGGLQTVATLPAETAGISLGDILKLPDGTLLISNFGFGTQGTIFSVAPGASTGTALTGLDPARRRIGMSMDSAGNLYTSYFVGGGAASPVGGVATLTIATGGVATETEISGASSTTPPGYKKIVGVAATPTEIYASDQTQKIIFKIAVSDHTVSQLATVTTADLLVPMPNGDLLTGGGSAITRVTLTGTVSTLPSTSFMNVRGMAYDPAGHRLFVVDHSSTAGTPDVLHTIGLAN